MNVIGIDIGGTSLRIGIIDEAGQLRAFEKVRQKDALGGEPVASLGEFIAQYIERHGATGSIAGLGIALPGTLNKDRSVVLNLPNIAGFDGQPVAAMLRARLGFPVHLLKDVSALFYYDAARFAIPQEGVTIACYAGTGIGNAICIDGKLLLGTHGAAGELGHIPVRGIDRPCGCGNAGCSEACAGGWYLAKLREAHFPNTPFEHLFVDHAAHEALREYVADLGATIATEVNILDPEVVILGGGVITMDGFPKDALEKVIRTHARKPLPEARLRFVYSDNTGENGVIGAALFAQEPV